jgi:membrane-bound ClpP family serine protease
LKTILIILIIGFIAYEFIEHVAFPLIWSLKQRKKKSPCGPEGLLGKLVEVKDWRDKEGTVFVDGALWKATSEAPLRTGNKGVIQKVEGLTLLLKPAPPTFPKARRKP